VEQINYVYVNDSPLEPTGFKFIPGKNRIAFSNHLMPGDVVTVNYSYSPYGDIVITNWDNNKGNYIFYNDYSVAINNTENSGFSFWPNPASDKIHVKIAASGHFEIELLNLDGKIIQEFGIGNSDDNQIYLLKLNNVKPGLYLLHCKTTNKTMYRKLIVAGW